MWGRDGCRHSDGVVSLSGAGAGPQGWGARARLAQAGVAVLVPTARFWLELHGSCAAWGDWLCRLYGGQGPELWFPNLGTVVAAEDLERAEWFRRDAATPLLRFDSWSELVCARVRARTRAKRVRVRTQNARKRALRRAGKTLAGALAGVRARLHARAVKPPPPAVRLVVLRAPLLLGRGR